MADSKRLFLDLNIKPEDILEEALGKHYAIFCQFMDKINQRGCTLKWEYLCGAWYCYVMYEGSQIGHVLAWDTGLELRFAFGKKSIYDIERLDIDNHIKKSAAYIAEKSDICMVSIDLNDSKSLDDALEILQYAIAVMR